MAEDTDQDFDMAKLSAAVPALDPRRPTVYSDEDNLTYPAPQSFSLPMRPQNANNKQAKKTALPRTSSDDHTAPKSTSPSESEKLFDSLYDPNDPDALYDYTPDSAEESDESALHDHTPDEPEESEENFLYDYSEDEPVPELKYDDDTTDMERLMHHVDTDTGIFDPNIPFSPMQSEGSDSDWTISGQVTIPGFPFSPTPEYPPSPTLSEIQTSLESGWPLVHLQIIDEFIHPATGVLTYSMRALDEHYDSVGWDPVYAFWIPADMAPYEAIEAWEARGRVPVTVFTTHDSAIDRGDDRDEDQNMDEPERSEWDDGFEVAGAEIEKGDFVPGEYEGEYVLPEAEQGEYVVVPPEEEEEEDCIL
ncbi:hypothetical protein MBLNU457_g3037t1 [Dothideomycetes sp. NU457]